MLFAIIPRVHTTAHANMDTMETELIAAQVVLLFTGATDKEAALKGNFTGACSVTLRLNSSEAGGDFV